MQNGDKMEANGAKTEPISGTGRIDLSNSSQSSSTMACEEIAKMLAISKSEAERSDAYSQLLQIEQQLTDDPKPVQQQLPSLLNSILPDISYQDEEIAALALKALGFIVYHPTLVSSLSEDNASAILQSLLEVITTTKMKAICNLATWCISIQQFESCFIVSHIHSIIRATVHALDNPMGSVSTTVEAFQAVIKLVAQASSMMKDLAHIWSPPIYRRLVSADKRERDMAERCLQKIKSTILPPLPLLSKSVATDIKQDLFLQMEKILQSHGCKVYVLQAWGWFIRLLGDHILHTRTLLNQMLKIPEQTFADPNSQVAWEALIDVLMQWPIQSMADQASPGKTLSPSKVELTASETTHQSEVLPPLKNLKLLMKPIVGVMSSKCDVSVRLSCWKTWNYVLHKLDGSLNDPAIQSIVLDPILKIIFESGPDNKNIWIWNLCMNLLEEFVSSKVKDNDDELDIYVTGEVLSPRNPSHEVSLKFNKDSFPASPIKWTPWSINQIEFLLNNVAILWKCGFRSCEVSDFSSLTLNGALRIFRLILRGVQSELQEDFKPLNEHVQVVWHILKFVQGLSHDINLKTSLCARGPNSVVFSLLEVIKDEIPVSTLTSSSFKMPINLKEIWDNEKNMLSDSLDRCTNVNVLGFHMAKIDMISPAVYLILVWLNFVGHLCLNASEEEKLLEKLGKLTQVVASGVTPLENIQVLGTVLYNLGLNAVNFNCNMQTNIIHEEKGLESFPFNGDGFFWLRVWKQFAKCLKEHLEFINDVDLTVDAEYQTIYSFLLFPVNTRIVYSSAHSNNLSTQNVSYENSCNSSPEKELDLVLQVWISLYNSVNLISSVKKSRVNVFGEGFCKRALKVIEEKHNRYISKQAAEDSGCIKLSCAEQNYFLVIVGGITAHVLKQVHATAPGMLKIQRQVRFDRFMGSGIVNSSPGGNGANDHCNVKGILNFVARFLELAGELNDAYADGNFVMLSGVFDAMACFLNRLSTRHDVLLFMQKLSHPLAKWLIAFSNVNRVSEERSPVLELEKAWSQLLNCLQKCQPAIIFDSSFLSLQAPLLVAAFQHIHSSIANQTIAFWEATYGNTQSLSYPESLVPVLVNLSQKVKMNLPSSDMLAKGQLSEKSCSVECGNDNVLTPLDNSTSNHLKPIGFDRPYRKSENSSIPDYQSVGDKLTTFGANNYEVYDACNHIRVCEPGQHSHLADRVPSSSLQVAAISGEEESGKMTQEAGSSQGRKKLVFMEDSPQDYVSIPSAAKRKCPLTEHQREVKRAQRGHGMGTMGHGPGIKTYTAADFSQGNGDSEEPEFNIADIIFNKCKEGS